MTYKGYYSLPPIRSGPDGDHHTLPTDAPTSCMVGSRTATAVAGLLASLLVSAAAWYYLDTLLLFLLLPFLPFLWRRERESPPVRECPACGFSTRHPEFDHCPRDGTPLDRRRDRS
ncbi:MAG: hypothetical protein ABEH58_01045 [Haloplanus sp.]